MNKPLLIDTAIIGCGIAGISTAVHLMDNNLNDLLIFEAQDYIGGRCRTVLYGNGFLELGCEVFIKIFFSFPKYPVIKILISLYLSDLFEN